MLNEESVLKIYSKNKEELEYCTKEYEVCDKSDKLDIGNELRKFKYVDKVLKELLEIL